MRGFHFRISAAAALMAPWFAAQTQADSLELTFRGLAPAEVLGTRVVGGEIASVKLWPWQVGIYHASNGTMMFECGGSLIDRRWVLSAAHCFADSAPSHYRVVESSDTMSLNLAEHSKTAHVVEIDRVAVHADYSDARSENDIALLELKTPAGSAPVMLVGAPASRIEAAGVMGTVTGWGYTRWVKPVQDKSGRLIKVIDAQTNEEVTLEQFWTADLKKVEVPLVDLASCQQTYADSGKTIDARTLCAGYPQGGKDSCQGDSGGPLVTKVGEAYAQVGIVSWGSGCARADHPGVYTRVSAFEGWITKTTRRNSTFAHEEGSPQPNSPPAASPANPKPDVPDNAAGVSASFRSGDLVRVGQDAIVEVTTRKPGYLLLFDATPDGSLTQIFPTKASMRGPTGQRIDSNRITPDKPLILPDRRNPYAGFTYQIELPAGRGALIALLSERPLTAVDLPAIPKTLPAGEVANTFVKKLGDEMKRDLVVKERDLVKAQWSIGVYPYTIQE